MCIYTADTLTRRKQFYVGHTVADLKLSACYFLCGSFNCLLTLWCAFSPSLSLLVSSLLFTCRLASTSSTVILILIL